LEKGFTGLKPALAGRLGGLVACSSRQLGRKSPVCTAVLSRPAGLAGCGHAWRSRRDWAPCRGNSGTAGIMPGRRAGVAEAAPAVALGSGWWLGVGTEAARGTVRTDRGVALPRAEKEAPLRRGRLWTRRGAAVRARN
jgi:hypothetical protein